MCIRDRLNSSLFVKDIQLAADVEIITAEDLAVVSVQEPKKEEEIVEEIVEEMLEGEEGIEVEGEESAGDKDDSSATKKEEDSDGKDQKSKEEKQK